MEDITVPAINPQIEQEGLEGYADELYTRLLTEKSLQEDVMGIILISNKIGIRSSNPTDKRNWTN